MDKLQYFIDNFKKVNLLHKNNKYNFVEVDYIDNLENIKLNGIGYLYLINYNLNKLNLNKEIIDFVRYCEDNNLSIEFGWSCDGHFKGEYFKGDYDSPPEYPEFVLDYLNVDWAKVKDIKGNVFCEIPKENLNLIKDFLHEDDYINILEYKYFRE